jgi:zinc/manganese transport system substrate-binding protein
MASPAMAQSKLEVVATISILADLAKNVGGDRIDVAVLVGPNGDANVYDPSPVDARKLSLARLVVVNGLGLEGWMKRLVEASGTQAVIVVASQGVKTDVMDENGKLVTDPHAWQSVANAKVYVANIRDGLIKADAAGKADYESNGQAYFAKLDALEAEVKTAIAAIRPDRRKVITTHNAFGYFAAAYGMEFIAPEGVTTQSEAAARDVAKIIAQIRKEKIPAVFMENISDPRLLARIAEDSGARIGGKLYSDALSEPGGPAGTYIEMMRNNIRELRKALAR